ncbi:Bud-site selection protein [Bisporella sp. PMI_857]|nr:Bud-site selection protein [Bisporella sp. PMI_857]
MPKRKRSEYGDFSGERSQTLRKKSIQEQLTQYKKLLNRALKTAKGFERQKLGKRLKNATDAGKKEDVERIQREIEVLKGMELGVVVEGHLWKTLGKVKAFMENEELAEAKKEMKEKEEDTEIPEGDKKARANIMSGMFNVKTVKDTMTQVVNEMYRTLRIPPPERTMSRGGKDQEVVKKAVKGILKKGLIEVVEGSSEEEVEGEENDGDSPEWEGFASGDEEVPIPDEDDSDDEEGGGQFREGDIDDDLLDKYQTLLGGSSDEESFDEEAYKARRKSPPATRLSLSLSPSQSPSPSLPTSELDSDHDPQLDWSSDSGSDAIVRPSSDKKPNKGPPKTSTFLPSLMGGYWSGSEESASDIDEPPSKAVSVRKNRPGQMARRAIWEKKFKDKANHIISGQPTIEEMRNAKKKDDKKFRGRGRKEGRGGGIGYSGRDRGRSGNIATGNNAAPMGERREKRRDDIGILHPSWQAAKKAKTEQKTAQFAGKKVVFD